MDFLIVATRTTRSGMEIYPKFRVGKSKDLMIRGGDFYAVWDPENQRWSKDQDRVIKLVDDELRRYFEEHHFDGARVLYMWDGDSGSIDKWLHYVKHQCRDNYVQLDDAIVFANDEPKKENYSSHSLPYPLRECDISGYELLMSTLYSEEERHKLEWAIGAVVSGDSKWIQKFIVLTGDPGTGKSTVLKIIRMLFGDYCATIDAKAIGSASAQFALESLRGNPLVAVQDDTDLSKIEDNARLNSLISHEPLNVNEKFKSSYEAEFHAFLFLGSNKDVQITDSKSGLIRRLIDVEPSGNKLPYRKYRECLTKIPFELPGIAYHCLEVYKDDMEAYDFYVPTRMMRSTNVVYSFLEENHTMFVEEDGISLNLVWAKYKEYCDDSDIIFRLNKQKLKVELKGYFREFSPEKRLDDGTHVYNYFSGFKWDKLGMVKKPEATKEDILEELDTWILLETQESLFDKEAASYPAQYATSNETPLQKWEGVTTTLGELNTSKLHYVKLPENHIVIDFDIKNEKGEKDASLNIRAASSFPPTYVEFSKGGSGLHLHYIYTGDISQLSRVYSDDIEVKIFTGNSSLRRKLTACNDLPIAEISSGLPTKKEVKKVYNENSLTNERAIRTCIIRNLNKEYHAYTKPSIDFIFKILDDAYNNGVKYDVTDLYNDVFLFAAASHNNSEYCLKKVSEMKFKSEDETDSTLYSSDSEEIVFFDVEVFKNLFVLVYKPMGKKCITLINPKPREIEGLLRYRLVGFNNRGYDNHIIYARMLGYSNYDLYLLSRRLIGGDNNAKFSEAYNLSYTDVYDFSSAVHKQSLKKWEIDLDISHKELGIPWDEEVPEELWTEVAKYCCNDVEATEAVFIHLSGDWTARQILAELANGTVNDTTNQLTTKIIFEGKKKKDTMGDLVYTDLSTLFPGYKYEFGKSTYRGIEVGEGGFVYAEPGIHMNCVLLDIASMHPTSIECLNLFGKYTRNYSDLKTGRILIKHKDWDGLSTLLNGKLKPYVDKARESGDMSVLKDLSNALKTALNSAYGLTSAKFENQLRHPDNIDNIVAKRGSLFMVNLLYEVQARGFTVAHIKTDSIKIPNATPEIIQFVMDYGKQYGYSFEHEATYERMCLVNDAVYIAKYSEDDVNGDHKGEWTATGAQFQIPYVFKKMFSKEAIEFADLRVTKSVKTALYLDMNQSLPDVAQFEKEYDKLAKQLNSVKNPPSDSDAYLIIKRMEELVPIIAEGHDYKFVGRVGAFCPVIESAHGGLLVRENGKKYAAATGTKGYRWLEAEDIGEGRRNEIDYGYFDALVDDAFKTINKYGDAEWFIEGSAPWDKPDVPF